MYPHVAHVFVDGGYIREVGRTFGVPLPDPRHLSRALVESPVIQNWSYNPVHTTNAFLGRTTYYDALPDTPTVDTPELEDYWRRIELLEDMHLGFGALRGLKRRARQKGVDVLLAVDMLTGAFASIFDIAVLVAGDADFIPAVEEVKRRGVMVLVVADPKSLADDLRRAADRFFALAPESKLLRPL